MYLLKNIKLPKHISWLFCIASALAALLIGIGIYESFFRTKTPLERSVILENSEGMKDYFWASEHQAIYLARCGEGLPDPKSRERLFRQYDILDRSRRTLNTFNTAIRRVSFFSSELPLESFSPDGSWASIHFGMPNVVIAGRRPESTLFQTSGGRILKLPTACSQIVWKRDNSAFLALTAPPGIKGKSPWDEEWALVRYEMDSFPNFTLLKPTVNALEATTIRYLADGRLVSHRFGNGKANLMIFRSGATGEIEKSIPWYDELEMAKLKKVYDDFSVYENSQWVQDRLSPDGKLLVVGIVKYHKPALQLVRYFWSDPNSKIILKLIKTDGSGSIDLGLMHADYNFDPGSIHWLPDSKHLTIERDSKLCMIPIQ